MSTSLSARRSALPGLIVLIAITFLASSNAWAGNTTYNFVDYPAIMSDVNGYGYGLDTISGSIITDGTLGALYQSDILGGSFTISNTVNGPYTIPVLGNFSLAGSLSASSTALGMPIPPTHSYTKLIIDEGEGSGIDPTLEPCVFLQYYRVNAAFTGGYIGDQIDGGAQTYTMTSTSIVVTSQLAGFQKFTNGSNSVTLGGNSNWIIATAQPIPEPSTITLLGTALLGFGLVYLRRVRWTPFFVPENGLYL